MTCGKDAPDKDGVVRYAGCGKRFNWDRSDGSDSSLPDALPYNINVHFKPPVEPELLKVKKFGTHGENISCSACNDVVRGTMFKCINSRGTMLCWTCTRQLISCSVETLNRNTKLSSDLQTLVERGDISLQNALQMMPELLSRHTEHSFQVIQPERLQGVVVTAVRGSPGDVAFLRTGKTMHVLYGHKFTIGSTWTYSLDDTDGPVGFCRSDHETEVFPLCTVQLSGDLGDHEKIEVSQVSTALHLKFLSNHVFGHKPSDKCVGALKVCGGAFIKDHCRIADFYGMSKNQKFLLSYDELTPAAARKHMGPNWKTMVNATHSFKVWSCKEGDE